MSNLFIMDVKSDVTKVLNHLTYNKLKILDPFFTQSIKAVFSTDISMNSILIETQKKSEALRITKKIVSIDSTSIKVYENEGGLSNIENYCVYNISTGFPEEEDLNLVGSINLKNLITHLFSMGQEVVRIGLWDSESDEENYASLVIFSPESVLLENFDYEFEFQDEEEHESEEVLEVDEDLDVEDEIEMDAEIEADDEPLKDDNSVDEVQSLIKDVNIREKKKNEPQEISSLAHAQSLLASLENRYENLQLDYESNNRENARLTQKCKDYEQEIIKITDELKISQDQLQKLQNAINTLINLSQIEK
ncbi:hypothetical protein NEF87_004517 [Candidatus Lokiarchaeum ossiferum]|uniref:Uncharacterized protein n=1 Tax=Candidatus Lokiarchaeum ossiferum TaxID=2951803 RepID=A0ABY6I0X5_9ARCH|nr:hypothetical protein NEF87_004517 [Candidatus Lokiarchaeum sp. B-35]